MSEKRPMSAREAALFTLAACERQGAWSDGFLKKALREGGLDRREAALATRLCFGVLQNRMLLDWHLARFCKIRLDRLELNVLCALRIAAYQLLFLDKIPAGAAVNEAVELTRKYCRNPRAAGMVNGVLRAMLRAGDLPEPTGADRAETLSLRYSHPRWLTEEFIARLGEDGAERLLSADNDQPPIAAQVNTTRATPAEAVSALSAGGVETEPHPWLPDCLILKNPGDLERLSAYREGLFYIQDPAARLAVTAAGLRPGMRVLDACAAPGGKSFAAAIDMEDRGEIISCDIHSHKIGLLEAGRDRLGLSIITPALQSAAEFRPEWEGAFDAVITDVPCSGLGVIRKKPDIRYKDPKPMERLPALQQAILDNCARYVKPGGTLLYSTCTLLERENQGVVDGFLAGCSDFLLEPFTLPAFGRQPGMMTFWPHIHHTDGFFVAKLRKRG